MSNEIVQAQEYLQSQAETIKELDEIREQLRMKPDSIEDEQVLIKYLTKRAFKENNINQVGALADLSAKLAKESRLGATARSEYLHRRVVEKFMETVFVLASTTTDIRRIGCSR